MFDLFTMVNYGDCCVVAIFKLIYLLENTWSLPSRCRLGYLGNFTFQPVNSFFKYFPQNKIMLILLEMPIYVL